MPVGVVHGRTGISHILQDLSPTEFQKAISGKVVVVIYCSS